MLKQVEDTDHAPDDHAMLEQVEGTDHAPDDCAMLKQVEAIDHALDDQGILKQVQASHAPDGREFAVKPLLDIIEDIFRRSAPGIDQGSKHAHSYELDDKTVHMLDPFTVNKVSFEISCKCSGRGDARETTLGILKNLGSYAWDAKVVLAMAAFALNYGEFGLVSQHYTTNPFAKSLALLKQLPKILERADTVKSKFEALSNLIKAMLDLAKLIAVFKELSSMYIESKYISSPDVIASAKAVYWTIRSIVYCSTQIMGHEYTVSTAESSEQTCLQNQLDQCYKILEVNRLNERYQALVTLTKTPHSDNMEVLSAFIDDKEKRVPLVDCPTMIRESLDVLRMKNVLLLISDLDVSQDELYIIKYMYQESRQDQARPIYQYKVVWMPVVDMTAPWTDEKQKQYESLQRMMPWYSIHCPSMVNPDAARYVKEFWHFKKKPIVVVLDPEGKVVNTNAYHMMWIWGSLAFPFTSAREETLWGKESWRLELLTHAVDSAIPAWVNERKFVCLFGGENMDWIRQFTKTARKLAEGIGLPLEMVYMGKSNPIDKVIKTNMDNITKENLSHTLKDIRLISFFWLRLESMWLSKMKYSTEVKKDRILQEITAILSFDGSNNCWAGIYRVSEMAKAKGETILKSFNDFLLWKKNANDISFIPALNQRLHEVHSPHHCNRLIWPDSSSDFPEMVVCPECNLQMEKVFMYRCCDKL
ncbi:hypothetical protein Ddye_031423 [Dipteronia dyeriana]|uniref:Sieve element occlusion n=1 Tax=Dipteronia dyeriana TaxID=168575 RepID=A0AAD9WMK1_9ROSI|nr:hypothetical protein Ddye_031423 [Dipteronia dyeriana]